MASIIKRPNGNRWVQFTNGECKRQTIRLGKATAKVAQEVSAKVEALSTAAIAKLTWEREVSEWVAGIGNALHAKLSAVGLVPKRDKAEPATLAAYIDNYIYGRKDVKPATKEVWRQGKLGLVNCFGANRDLTSITQGDADSYKLAMIGQGLASYTIRKRLQWAKTWFKSATRKRLIPSNPFDDVSIKATMPNRMRFVTPAETQAILDACPCHEWRMIVALARWGGVRCPSEVLSLRWQDIDWKRERITVQSPKTAHHEGKAERVIPLFPELYEHLQTSFERAPEGAVYVVNERFRKSAMGKSGWRNTNLRTTFKKIVKRAGLKVWPRLFHNLRSSRQTELEERFPTHVVCAWLGNSEDIARRHYLQITDEHFGKALSGPSVQNGGEAKGEAQAKQKPKQHTAAQACTVMQKDDASPPEGQLVQEPATQYIAVQEKTRMGRDSNPR
jgi:integrase